ncbi:MAG TPA: serine hydrolase [Amaricoccus sp.]|nr:serine hydrolase [Amaricoccus sp.]
MRVPALVLLALVASPALADESPAAFSAVPIPEGQVAMATAAVDGLVADVLRRTGVPGMAVAVVEDGKVLLARGYGVRVVGKPDPVDPATVFQLASVSKSVAATVVATEVAAGRVAWDTPMATLLPWFALSDPRASALLTVGDLFAHRSGLPDHAGDRLEDLGFDRHAVLERLRLLPLDGFRDSYAYTNFGLTAAAEGVATAAGKDWATLSDEAIYQPLGMTHTSSRFADYMAEADRAIPHMRRDGAWAPLAQRDPDAQSPAGGVSSSAEDMAKWMTLVLGEDGAAGAPRIASAALMPALTPQSVSGPPEAAVDRPGFYGYGFNVGVSGSGRTLFGHSGAFYLGAATCFYLVPSARTGIVVLSNAQPIGAVEAVAIAFTDLVQFGRVTRDWLDTLTPLFAHLSAPVGRLAGARPPAAPEPAAPDAAYLGSYANDYFGPAEVTGKQGGGLVLTLGPGRVAYSLEHWTGDTFAFEPRGENAPDGSRSAVSFVRDGDKAAAMTVELYDEDGLGTFRR